MLLPQDGQTVMPGGFGLCPKREKGIHSDS